MADVDYDSVVLANIITEHNSEVPYVYEQFTFSLPWYLVQKWIDDPNNNTGLLLKTHDRLTEGYTRFLSSDYATGQAQYPYRPKLTIDYSIDTQPAPISIAAKSNQIIFIIIPPYLLSQYYVVIIIHQIRPQ